MPPARLIANEPGGAQLRLLTFDAPPTGYTRPGQYLTAQLGTGKPAFFAIASSPGEPLQLLMKVQGETAEALAALQPGATVEISEAKGPGFALERTVGRPLVVLVNGSGISAARPVLQAEVAAGLPRPVHLYYGVMAPEGRAFLWDLEAWANAGVKVHTVVDPAGAPGWHGRTGYVQDHARADGLCRAEVSVVLVGLPILLELARAAWEGAGCPAEQILTNF